MTSEEPLTFSLALSDANSLDLEHPRRLLKLPCNSVLAYGGDDGIISSLVMEDNRFQAIQRCDEAVRAVAFSEDGTRVAVGFDDGQINIFKFDDYEFETGVAHPFAQVRSENKIHDNDLLSQDQTLSHQDCFAGPTFDSPIRDMCFIKNTMNSFWLVIACESGMCMVNADSSETLSERHLELESQEAHGHCGIRGVSMNDDSSLMASLAMDGRLCVWTISTKGSQAPDVKLLHRETRTCIAKKDAGEVHGADFFDRSCRPHFHGDFLATPGQLLPLIRKIDDKQLLKCIEITNCDEGGHVESIAAIAFFDQNHFVTSGCDKRIILWRWNCKTGAMTPLHTVKLESPATDFFLQNDHSLYAACATGDCTRLNLAAHFKQTRAADDDQVKVKGKVFKKSVVQDESEDEDIEFSSQKDDSRDTKNKVRFLDDEADEDDDNVSKTSTQKNEPSTNLEDEDRHQDILFDHGNLLDDADDFGSLTRPVFQSTIASAVPTVPPQPAFSISSTPLDLTRRFLCWNHIGSITNLHGDGDLHQRNTIDINFTDSAYKRPISFTDNMNFILGSLGEDGAIFASDLQEDDDNDSIQENLDDLQMSENTKQAVKRSRKKRTNQDDNPMGSSIFFYRFETFGSLREKDWYLKLPDGERVLGSACGQGWAAVMTSRRFLRLFSSGGNQAQVVWLKGEPVTMTGRGRFLAVFYHQSNPLPDKTQQLEFTLWDTTSFAIVSHGAVTCLSKGSSLSWAGFSNDCSLLAMDSDGMLSMLVPCGESGFAWSPVLDTVGLRKSSDDQFWPVSVYDGKLVCVPLKGGNAYPDAARRPVTTTLGLRIPLAKSSIAKNTVLEELSVRSNLALAQKKILREMEDDGFEQEYVGLCVQVDKVTLKLFASTLDAGKVERALDLIDRLHLEKSYDIAIRLADHNRKLVDLIEDAKERKFLVGDDMDGDEDHSPSTTFMDRLAPSRQISPEASHNMKRNLGTHVSTVAKRSRICLTK